MNRKKLLITGSTFPRYEDDTEPRFILDLAKAMTKYMDVTVLVPADPKAADEEVLEGVHVIRYHYFPIHSLETLCYPGAIVPRIKQKKARVLLVPWLFFALHHQLFKRRTCYDVVHANWLIPQGIVQSYVNKPYIVTGHGGDVTSMNKGVMKKLKARCLRRAAGVTAVSQPLMDVLDGIHSNENTAVISMGCDTELFGDEHYVRNYFEQGEDKVILFVGRLAEKKGVTYLIEAMQYIEHAKLVIVGDGDLKESLKAQAEQMCRMKGRKCIAFLGAKTHEQLKSIYASADLFAMPSVTAKDGDQEGFGLVMLEALASGLPVVASRSGGIPDLIRDGMNGFLAEEKNAKELADRINLVLGDQNIYNEFKCAARSTAQAYDYKNIALRYKEFIDNAMRTSVGNGE